MKHLKPTLMYTALALAATIFLAGCRQESTHASSNPAPSAGLSSRPLSYADVVDHVAPAVVTVRSSRRVSAPQQFPFLFGRFFGLPNQGGGENQVERALGSGVIVRSDGHILTNQHVISGAQDIKVDLGHKTYSAKLVGADAPSDLAVLKIDASNLPVLSLGNSDQVKVGDICLAVGNPLGIGETVTSGIISAKGRRTGLSNGAFEDFLQTDAPINQGNSGGALVNTTGELIGINSQIVSTTGGNIGLGFAIPSNMAKTVMDQLIGKGKVSRGHLGVSVQPLTSDLAASLGVKEEQGVVVNSVDPNGPAAKAGLQAGDVITAFNGKTVEDGNSFRNEIASAAPGSEITLTIARNGKQQDAHVKLEELNESNANSQGQSGGGSNGGRLGLSVEPLTPDLASQLGLRPGTQGLVVEAIDPGGPAADAGIKPGDVIEQINRQPVKSAADVGPALARSGSRPALLLINRQGQALFATISPRR